MNDQSGSIAALVQEASETHHSVYRVTDGDDPDWASWYADWLVNLSELPQILGTTWVRSELVWLLVSLDRHASASADAVGSPFGSPVADHLCGAYLDRSSAW